MNSQSKDIAEYIIIVVSEFARRYSLSDVQAYRYLKHFAGIDFLEKQYKIAHTLSLDDVLNGLAILCRRNGGVIA